MKTYALLLALLAPHCTDGFAPVHQPATMPATCSQLSADSNNSIDNEGSVLRQLQQTGLAVAFSMAIFAAPAFGADFAGKDISGQDFSGQDLAGKDFSSAIAKGTNFKGANLQGASFQKANLVNCDFTGADLANTNYVDAVLDGSVFKDVTAQKSTWSASILDIKDLENADLTDSLWPSKLRIMICDMDEIKGTNAKTGVESKESLLCTDYMHKS